MGLIRPCLAKTKNPFLAFSFSFLHSSLITPLIYEYTFHYFFFGPKSFHIRTFKPLFGPITILSLSFVTFRVSRFPVSHLTHETVKLGLQNTLNMSKTTRVYFLGVTILPPLKEFRPRNSYSSMCMLYNRSFLFMSFTEAGA